MDFWVLFPLVSINSLRIDSDIVNISKIKILLIDDNEQFVEQRVENRAKQGDIKKSRVMELLNGICDLFLKLCQSTAHARAVS